MKMLRKALLIFLFLVFFLLGCFPARELRLPQRIYPEEVIQSLASSEKNLHSMGAYLELKFKGKGKWFSTEAEILYKEPQTFTIYFKSSSHLNILKSVFKSDSVLFYLPQTNEYYHDSYENFSQTKGWEWGIELKDFLNLVIGKNGLEENNMKFVKRERNHLIFVSENDGWERKFWVDHRKNHLVKSEWRKKRNGESLIMEYNRYKDYDVQRLPRLLEIKIPEEKETLKIRFKKRKKNLPLPDKRFTVKIPSDAHRVWLKEKD